MDLTFITHRFEDATVLSVTGEVDHHSAPSLGSQISSLLDTGVDELVLDLRSVTFFDSSGLGALVGARKHAEQASARLVLANLAPNVLRIFTLTKMDSVFDIVATDTDPEG
jgi:anti-sigma B factor antagonist